MLKPINREEKSSFVLHTVCDFVLFYLSDLKGGISVCVLLASYGRVSLIVDQLNWQSCRSPSCTVVQWSWDHWWVVAKPENCRAYCHLIDSQRHRSIHTRVVHGSGARGRDFSMLSGSTDLQYGLRHVDGVPIWDGDISTLRDCETAPLWFRAGLKPGEQERAVDRLWANLQGPAREVVRRCRPQDFEDAREAERLLSILQDSPLAWMQVPDAYKKKQAYDKNQTSAKWSHRRLR